MTAERDDKEIGQISIYLTKSPTKFEQAIDWESNIRSKPRFADHSFTVMDIACRFLYFETITQKTNPPWLDFMNSRLPADEQIVFEAKVIARTVSSG